MAYRDELAAAQERIAQLEAELDDARAENGRLKAPKAAAPDPFELGERGLTPLEPTAPAVLVKASTALATTSPRRVGGLYYHPPATYFPLLRLYRSFLRELVSGRPKLEEPSSDKLSAWIAYVVLMPLVYCLWFPIYLVIACFAAPYVGAWCLALTPLVLLRVLASRLTFSPRPITKEGGWLEGEGSRGEAARLLLFTIFPVLPLGPLLLVFANVLDRSNDSSPALRPPSWGRGEPGSPPNAR